MDDERILIVDICDNKQVLFTVPEKIFNKGTLDDLVEYVSIQLKKYLNDYDTSNSIDVFISFNDLYAFPRKFDPKNQLHASKLYVWIENVTDDKITGKIDNNGVTAPFASKIGSNMIFKDNTIKGIVNGCVFVGANTSSLDDKSISVCYKFQFNNS